MASSLSPRILLVDDIPDEREMYSVWLRHEGYCTLQAATADDAYRMASELLPAAVVTSSRGADDGDALGVARRLKHDPRTRHVRVVLITSTIGAVAREAAVIAGCDLLVARPCLPATLVRAIDHMLGRAAPEHRGSPLFAQSVARQ